MYKLKDTDKMPFGKHKGKQMQHVPLEDLHWYWCFFLRFQVETSNVAQYINDRLSEFEARYPDGEWRPENLPDRRNTNSNNS